MEILKNLKKVFHIFSYIVWKKANAFSILSYTEMSFNIAAAEYGLVFYRYCFIDVGGGYLAKR